MSNEFDTNRIAVDFIQANLEKAIAIGQDRAKGLRNLVKSKFERTYTTYIERLVDRHLKAKSFFVRHEPIPLYEFFVPLNLSTQKRTLQSPGSPEIAGVSRNAVISGSGGSGKSMMMRHMLVSALISRQKTPIFLELRNVPFDEATLDAALLGSLRANGLEVDADYFSLAMEAGHFLILLDGFDEIDRKLQKRAAKAVQDLAEQYPLNWLILSSRPDIGLESWNAFTVFDVDPLDLEKAVSLVQLTTFDEAVREKFITDLRDGLFDKHQSFLSNPLLLSIMLLTYRDTAHIPAKLSIFYNQAYESLFLRHDALKGGYQRERRTSLDVQDFARVFSAFCVRSYDKRTFTFSVASATELLDKCKAVTNLTYESGDFLDDARQAVCLLVDEGMEVAFSHRSFQEYFAARFVAASPPAIKAQLIQRFASSIDSDQVIPLLHEMDAYSVELHYLLPLLEQIRTSVLFESDVTTEHHLRYLRLLFHSFGKVDGDEGISAEVKDSSLLHALLFAQSRYLRPYERAANIDEVQAAEVRLFGESFPGEDRVATADITGTEPYLLHIRASKSIWGLQFLEELLELETRLRERHRETGSLLSSVLD